MILAIKIITIALIVLVLVDIVRNIRGGSMKSIIQKDNMCKGCKYNTEEHLEYRNEGGNEFWVCDRARIYYGACLGKERDKE